MFTQRADKISSRQQRQVSLISKFTTNIEYLPGAENVVADSLSRVDSIRLPTEFSLLELARAQAADDELKTLLSQNSTSLNLKKIQWGSDHTTLVCDLTGAALCTFIPLSLRRRVFDLFHKQAHRELGRATD